MQGMYRARIRPAVEGARSSRAVLRGTLLAGLVVLLPGPGVAQGIDRELARTYFAEAARLGAADAGALWGVPLDGPLLFADRGTRELIANLPDSAGMLSEADGAYVGRLPDGVAIYNGALEWAGRRWTMLAWPLPYGRYERQRLVAHELFHRVQPTLGLPAANPANDHLDMQAARTWLRLEWRALQEALAQSDAGRREAIADALHFRAERRRLYPDGAESERLLELNEGLSEYTGVHVGIPMGARAGWVVRQLETADARSRTESVVRNFAYPSGAAYGLLLAAGDPQWVRGVTAASDLGALLGAAYDVAVGSDTTGLGARTLRYGGARLRAEEAAREAARLAQQAAFRARFLTGPTLTLSGTEQLQYSFDPNAVVPFDDGGTVYLTFEVQDVWGTLRVSEGGALVRPAGDLRQVVVSAPTGSGDGVVRGAGWELTLAEGWQVAPGARPEDRVLTRR